MAFCAQCGSEVQGNFCARCGARQNSRTGAFGQVDENIVGAACYLFWAMTGVLFLVLEPYNRSQFVRFHAFQSILTFIALFLGFAMLRGLAFLPVIGLPFGVMAVLYPVAGFALWLFLIYKAYKRERWMLPVIGPFAGSLASR